jgi:hypothetical protein
MALFSRRREATVEGDQGHERLRGAQSLMLRLVATLGIIGVGTALAAILGSQDIRAWVIGIVVSTLSVLLAATLWSSRAF